LTLWENARRVKFGGIRGCIRDGMVGTSVPPPDFPLARSARFMVQRRARGIGAREGIGTMIEYLRGTLLEIENGHAVIDVQGVGYGVAVPATTQARLGEPGHEAALWVRIYVREDTLRLYGFATRHERDVFDVFLGLSGVGPGIGLAVLSQITVADIVQAVAAGDTARLRKVKGIGPKMADKLLLELKGKIGRLTAGLAPDERAEALTEPLLKGEAARDAVAGLESLGVRPVQARKAVVIAVETLGEDATVDALVREGLKHRHTL
jgi:Holliday junction DNA helicase RuvA